MTSLEMDAAIAARVTYDGAYVRPQWDQLTDFSRDLGDGEECDVFWQRFSTRWCEAIAKFLGPKYKLVTTDDFLVLSAWSESATDTIVQVATSTLSLMTSQFPRLVWTSKRGFRVIMAFDSYSDYEAHLSQFDVDGLRYYHDGMCIRSPYSHVALAPRPHDAVPQVVVHEVTHVLTAQLDVPFWLAEGLANLVESAVFHWNRPIVSRNRIIEHLVSWHRFGIESFWDGTAFVTHDGRGAYAWELAELLTRTVLLRGNDSFQQFVLESQYEDSGEAAARHVLGHGLGALVSKILGAGDWDPPHCPPPTQSPNGQSNQL